MTSSQPSRRARVNAAPVTISPASTIRQELDQRCLGLNASRRKSLLLLQGGGALGSYQAGAYEALAAAKLLPSWIAGISIGAVNGAIIAGNPPELAATRLAEFWRIITESASPFPLFEEMVESAIHSTGTTNTLAVRRPGLLHAANAVAIRVQYCTRRSQLLRYPGAPLDIGVAGRLRPHQRPQASHDTPQCRRRRHQNR